jgi:hypothetical protein
MIANFQLYAARQEAGSSRGDCQSRRYAKERAEILIRHLRRLGISLGKIAVLGPGNASEQMAFHNAGCNECVAIDLSDQACRLIRADHFDCIQGDINQLQNLLQPSWNFYACHSLEHMLDAKSVATQMKRLADEWIYFEIPIEPNGTTNPAHYSPFASHEQLFTMMLPWVSVHSVRKPKGLKALFVRD